MDRKALLEYEWTERLNSKDGNHTISRLGSFFDSDPTRTLIRTPIPTPAPAPTPTSAPTPTANKILDEPHRLSWHRTSTIGHPASHLSLLRHCGDSSDLARHWRRLARRNCRRSLWFGSVPNTARHRQDVTRYAGDVTGRLGSHGLGAWSAEFLHQEKDSQVALGGQTVMSWVGSGH